MPVQPKHPVGRNDPCFCGSTLKYKKCHGDPLKQEVCNRVANEKMVELIRAEQRKKVIRLQQIECGLCGHTGKNEHGKLCIACQFITDDERLEEEYKRASEKKKLN